MSTTRIYTPLDQLLKHIDQGVRTLFGKPSITERENPSVSVENVVLDADQIRQVAGLMRINHAGEVAAQALYQGQALGARSQEVRARLERSAEEENDHLAWCEGRLNELESHTSILNPLWYTGALTIGLMAGLAGDRWSLGFVVETERQVEQHLKEHLQLLPIEDKKSRVILDQMREDEAHHATVALEAGGVELPTPIKVLMGLASKVMTMTAKYV